MAYNYYPTVGQGWGTSQYELRTPPMPSIRPDPMWSGWDYYRAYGANPDRSLFSSIYERALRSPSTGHFSGTDTRSIHRRVYSGTSHLGEMLPGDFGSAAAYEAYRTWKYHPSLFPPLGVESESTREALMGHAMAEASRLWQNSGRGMDTYGQHDALQSAAATASRLYYRRLDESMEDSRGGYHSRSRSGFSSSPHAMQSSGYDNDSYGYRRSRRMSVPSMYGAGGGYPSTTTGAGGFGHSPAISEAQLGLSGSLGTHHMRGGSSGGLGLTPPSTYSTPYNSHSGGVRPRRNSTYSTYGDGTGMGGGIGGMGITGANGYGGTTGMGGGSYSDPYSSDQYGSGHLSSGMPGMQSSVSFHTPQDGFSYPGMNDTGLGQEYGSTNPYGVSDTTYGSHSYQTGGGGGYGAPATVSGWSNQASYGGTGRSTYGGYVSQPAVLTTQPMGESRRHRSKHRDGSSRRRSHSISMGTSKYGGGYSSRYY